MIKEIEGKKRTTMYVDQDLRERINKYMAENGSDMTKMFHLAMTMWLDKKEPRKRKQKVAV